MTVNFEFWQFEEAFENGELDNDPKVKELYQYLWDKYSKETEVFIKTTIKTSEGYFKLKGYFLFDDFYTLENGKFEYYHAGEYYKTKEEILKSLEKDYLKNVNNLDSFCKNQDYLEQKVLESKQNLKEFKSIYGSIN